MAMTVGFSLSGPIRGKILMLKAGKFMAQVLICLPEVK